MVGINVYLFWIDYISSEEDRKMFVLEISNMLWIYHCRRFEYSKCFNNTGLLFLFNFLIPFNSIVLTQVC